MSESGSHNNEHKNEEEEKNGKNGKKWKKMDAKYEPLSLRHYILIRKGVKLPRKRSLMHSWEYFLFKSEIWVSSNGRTLNSVFILVNKINIDQQT